MDKNQTHTHTIGAETVSFTPGSPAVYSTDAFTGIKAEDKSKEKLLIDPEAKIDSADWISWGDDDDFPNKLLEKLGKLGVGKAALETNADLHYGLGVHFFYDKYTEDGKIIPIPKKIDDWQRLKRDQNQELVQAELCDSLEYFYIAFVQFMWNVDKTRINWAKVLNTPYCRFLKQDPKTGKVSGIRYSAKFPERPSAAEDFQDINIMDPKDPKKDSTFVVPFFYSTWGKLFYPEPDYYTVFRNKWVDIAIGVPELINAMYTNFATLKYHIKIPKEYFYSKYKDWGDKTEKEQIDIFTEEQKRMNEFLTGTKNAGKAFITIFGLDENGKEIPGWVIEPIKNYLEATAELPNNSAANSEILFAMSLDPSLLGFGIPGGKNLSGSGSDKRESRSNKVSNLKRARLVSLQLPKLIAKLNGYYDIAEVGADLYPNYLSSDTSQTLDQNPTGSQTITQ